MITNDAAVQCQVSLSEHGDRRCRPGRASHLRNTVSGIPQRAWRPQGTLIPTNRCKLTQKASKGQETSERRPGWLGPILHATHRLTRPWSADGPRAEAQPSVSGLVVRLTSFQESKQA